MFFPVAVETLSPMNASAYEFFEILGRKITDLSGDSREVAFFSKTVSHYTGIYAALFRDTFTLHDDPDL